MHMKAVSRNITVSNPNGVHCRVAERLISIISEHEATVQLTGQEGEPVDCTSILEILSLGLGCGSSVCFTAQGPDAHQVADAVEHLLTPSALDSELQDSILL